MKIETGRPMSSTPSVCQKPSTSNAQTIAPIAGGDHSEDSDERGDERPRAKGSVVRHVEPPSTSLTRRDYSARAWMARTVSIVSASLGDLSGR